MRTDVVVSSEGSAPAGWADVRRRLLTRVFYAHPEEDVVASTDLVGDGYLDSMSVLVILGLFDEQLGEGNEGLAIQRARIPDTTTIDAMEAFYARLIKSRVQDT